MKPKKTTEEQSLKHTITQTYIAIIGTVFGISAFIIAFISFTKSDDELQAQIDKLTQLVENTQAQIEVLNLSYNLAIEQYNKDVDQRKKDIKPNLSIQPYDNDHRYVLAYLSNSGQSARNIKFVPSERNNFKIFIPYDFIGGGNEKTIYFENLGSDEPIIEFTIYYTDIDGNSYSSIILLEGEKEIFEPIPNLIKN